MLPQDLEVIDSDFDSDSYFGWTFKFLRDQIILTHLEIKLCDDGSGDLQARLDMLLEQMDYYVATHFHG